ncbi:DEAD/DEAH box helicase domain protein [Mesorhizobium plurifarium]|uniref:DEAD/DEAH box helicase domain protein n=1 Tax=Mesorhizobium plurifarium TaxID=69974 RepID=A0A090E0B6_MESPL|nr:DEAD/DEAH box helicase domain protein [Mesorhizobium plurifarium]
MMQELADKVWNNSGFHDAAHRIELAWLTKEIGGIDDGYADITDATRLMRSAAILACSETADHRRAAFRVATCAYDLFGTGQVPLDQALRMVLTRLGNFPSIGTRADVASARVRLPLVLAAEEIASANAHEVTINGQTVLLTDFQQRLWLNLLQRRRIALAAPTSAGKSFVLQGYLSALFDNEQPKSVVYIVPTRALIAQVAEDLTIQFRGMDQNIPDIVTVPVDAETNLAERAIYVMTQERVQLALGAHPDLSASVIIVDEAHSIADGSRGVLLQWVIDDLLIRNPASQILFASPAIRNLDIFGRLFGLTDLVEFASIEPTVAQNFLVTTVQSATKGELEIHTVGDGSRALRQVATLKLGRTVASRTEKLVHIPAVLGRGHSNIIYANGAAEAESVALQLAELMSDREPTELRLALSDLAKEAVHANYALVECVKHGVAFHYSNIPTQLRRAIETAVSSGEIDYLVCTSTLLQGVNLPTKNIFMFAPEKGRARALESTDFWNLAGRAGRLKREFQGNIFLIDYDKWKKKPLHGPKDSIVTPAIESSLNEHHDQLLTVISGSPRTSKSDNTDLETTFVRLYTDFKGGDLNQTFERAGIAPGDIQSGLVEAALAAASDKLTLPTAVLRRTPSISAHKQQRLYDRLNAKIAQGADVARTLIPLHPRESEAFHSYANILELCHEIILGIDTSKNLHRFHALIARRWMLGVPLPQIIDEQISRNASKPVRTTIRSTLDLIEGDIRFQAVRLFGCYSALLVYALDSAGLVDMASSIPSLPLYLEIGASDKTMISFISLGLSRVTAMKLNEMSARKDLDKTGALRWLRTRPLEALGLSPLLLAEVRAIAIA